MAQAALSTERSRPRKKRRVASGSGSDWWLLAAATALTALGVLIVYSATYALSYMNTEATALQPDAAATTTLYLSRHLIWAALGGGMMLFTWRLDYRLWKRLSLPLMALTVVALLLLLIIGKAKFGAVRWFFSGSVQPAEAAKLVTIIYVAHWASSKGERLRTVGAGLIPFGMLIGIVCGLILLQPSFSTALLVGAVATTMFLIAGADLRQLLVMGIAASGVLYAIARGAAYRMERIITWQDPWTYETGSGYQTAQVLYALARGGLMGQGLGSTKNGMLDIPVAHTDAIFAILGQEMGFVACIAVLGLFLILAYRGYRIAAAAPDAFGTVLASGITCWIAYQALFNIAVITNTIPNTGIPLPFISFGGSGLVVALTGMGILLSISRVSARQLARSAG